MSVYSWPPNVLPQKVTWRYAAVSRAAISPFDGDLTILSRGGDRWTAECSFSPIFDDAAADVEAFFARIKHQAHQFVLPPHFYKRRGSFAPANVAPNGGTFDVVGPWTAANGAMSIETGMMRVQNTASSSVAETRSGAVTVTANTQYVLRIECLPGSAANYWIVVGTTAGSSNIYTSGAFTASGIFTATFNSGANTTLHFTVYCNTNTNGDFVYYDNLLIERCALTQGSTAPGDLIKLDGLAVSTAELLKKSDMIEVNGQLLKLLNALTTDSTGLGIVRVSPSVRVTIPDNTPVILGTPQGRFVMKDDPAQWDTVGFFEKSFTIAIVEDITT